MPRILAQIPIDIDMDEYGNESVRYREYDDSSSDEVDMYLNEQDMYDTVSSAFNNTDDETMTPYERAEMIIDRWKEHNMINLTLNLSHLYLTELPPLPNNVVSLDISFNRLTYLPNNLPSTIMNLLCADNLISYIPSVLPPMLCHLDMKNNNIYKISTTLPPYLKYLDLHGNFIRKIPNNLPPNLIELQIGLNKLEKIPDTLPDSINRLDISYNHLEHLPLKLPKMLVRFLSNNNKIRYIKTHFPENLQALNISCNRLKMLPENLPNNLLYLDCSYNNLTHLPENIPDKLYSLNCTHNRISENMAFNSIIENIPIYMIRWKSWWEEQKNINQEQKHNEIKIYKEELIKRTWHPSRFIRWCLDINEQREWDEI
jgi:hypothetical protein